MQSPRTFDELKSLTVAESGALKEQISKEFQQNRRDLAHKQCYKRLLKSLWYPEIHTRQERVGEAHQNTFQWIYEPGGFDQSTRRWNSFVQWLKEGSGIYWINGKAGSGKSTLMNYICQDDRTTNLLRTWSGTQGLFTPTFFFWNAGTTLENTSEGLLRSLLYQVLQKFPNLAPLSCQNQSALGFAEEIEHEGEQIAAWTERRLHATLGKVLRQAQEICHICIFIDGLDEVSEEPDAAIAMIKKMQSANTKICISSRPDRPYTDAFESFAKLRLQYLTEPDIRRYVVDKLQPSLPTESEDRVSIFLDEIARKAQGVFLWVKLVVKALQRGLQNDDSLEQLQIRVDTMPSDMEALYAKMLSSIEIAYQAEAALLFQMDLAIGSHSLLDITLALCKGFDRMSEMSVQKVLGLCRQNLKRIPDISAGFFEVYQREEGGGEIQPGDCYLTLPCRYTFCPETVDISGFERYTRVVFIHRTAIDFLRQSKQGRLFLEQNAKTCSSPHSTYVRALLAKVTLLGFSKMPCRTDAESEKEVSISVGSHADGWCNDWVETLGCIFVEEIMVNVFLEEYNTATAQISLCEDVDRTLAILCQRYPARSPHSQWFTRWRRFEHGAAETVPVPLWLRMSSLSSSQVFYSSARSEPGLFQKWPVDFHGIAATLGLSRFVISKFDLRQDFPDDESVNYLLCCSLLARGWSVGWHDVPGWLVETFNLMTDLLSRGGNPNIYVESLSSTIWGAFLVSWISWNCVFPAFAQEIQTASTITAKAFLKAGADAHMKYLSRLFVRGSLPSFVSPNSDRRLQIYLHSEMSALYIVRRSLKALPEWKAIEDIILAKGGREFHDYIQVTVYTHNGRPYKISERQHEKLVAALNAHWHSPLIPHITDIEHQILSKICNEHLASALDSDGQISSEDDVSSNTDVEEEFYESLDKQSVVEVQEHHAVE